MVKTVSRFVIVTCAIHGSIVWYCGRLLTRCHCLFMTVG